MKSSVTGAVNALPVSGSVGFPPSLAASQAEGPSSAFLQVLFLMGGELPDFEGSIEVETKEDRRKSEDGETSPAVIADAVIRSMLRLEATPPPIPAVAVPMQTLSAESGEGQDKESNMVESTGCKSTPLASGSSQRALPKAPIAFALRLTPHEQPDKDVPGDHAQIPATLREPKESLTDHTAPDALPAAQAHALPMAHVPVVTDTAPRSFPPPSTFEAPSQAAQPSPPAVPVEEREPVRPSSTHELAVRVSAPDKPDVDLHVAQRGSEVKVAVRASDPVLRAALQDDINALVGKLEHAGFHAETISTREVRHDSPDTNSEQRNSHPGDSQARQQQQQQHQQRRQWTAPQTQWIETLEDTHDYQRS